MEITQELNNGFVIVAISGRLDALTCFEAEASVNVAAAAERGMALDLSNLNYVSSAGLRVVLLAAKTMRAAKKRFVVFGLKSPVLEVFEISNFSKILSIVSTREEALSDALDPRQGDTQSAQGMS